MSTSAVVRPSRVPASSSVGANDTVERVQIVDSNGTLAPQWASNTAAVPAGTSTDTVVKASPGRLFKVIVTTVGTAAQNIYDNATTHSGTVLAAIPASAPVGTVYDLNVPAANGITVGGIASSPGITVSYA